ncbi:cadherin-like beta sandwich domain-containing protein, partial [Acutalibacter sp. 1XD8-36]|uniref:cadherin-like beta sandwich domain-containing protein n=1 Tax=Acutalibacter sp. 1XD8-36 TaxID=2320852 RepID=UPI00141297B4
MNKSKFLKRPLAALLAILMVVALVPMSAFAADAAIPQGVPTLAIGVSANAEKMAEEVKAAANVTNVTVDDANNVNNLLWFVMTGMGSTDSYSLSMMNESGKELLGEKYVSYGATSKNFTTGSKKYFIYLSLDQAADDGKNAQVDKKVLADGVYTVKLKNETKNTVVATETFTLKSEGEGENKTWTGKQTIGEVEFKGAESGFADKNLSDVQSGTPKFDVTSAGTDKWNVKVSGATLKYITGWTGFNSAVEKERQGYYLGISVPRALNGNVVSVMTLPAAAGPKEVKETAFTEYNGSYCDLFIHLGETAEEVKAKADWSFKIKYGNLPEHTYTFDFSGLSFPSEEPKFEALDMESGLLDKGTNELQADIVGSVDASTKTITVTGTSYYVSNWTSFDGDTTKNSGNFVAFKITNPANMPVYLLSPTENIWKPHTDGSVLRIQNQDGNKGKIMVGGSFDKGTKKATGGTEWTIDFNSVDMMKEGDGALQITPVTGTVLGKKGTDLQSNISTTRKTNESGVTTITVRGNSNYIPVWTQFSTNPDYQKGHYLALKLTAGTGDTIKVQGTSSAEETLDSDGIIVLTLNKMVAENDYRRKVTVTPSEGDAKTYYLDFSAVKRLPAEIKGVSVDTDPTNGNKLKGLEVAYKDGKIILSGLVEPMKENENLFNDAVLSVDIGAEEATRVNVRITKVGDKLEASATTTVAGNTLVFDTSMLIIKNPDATDVATFAAPASKVSDTIPEEQKEAANAVAEALGNSSTKVEEDILQKYANVISNDSANKGSLITEAAKIVAENSSKIPAALKDQIEEDAAAAANGSTDFGTNSIVQAYVQIEVVGVESTDGEITSFKLAITPMARTIISTESEASKLKIFDANAEDASANSKANAIVVKDEEIKIAEATTVKLALPDAYKAKEAFILHDKGELGTFKYEGKISGISPRVVEFNSENGFSDFTISATEPMSNDATLSSVKVGEYTAEKKSDSEYAVTVAEGTDVTKLALTLTATDSNVKSITVNGAAYTEGMTVDLTDKATIVVTAEDGTEATYTLTATVDGTTPAEKPSDKYTDLDKVTNDTMRDKVKAAIDMGIMGSTSSTAYVFAP